MPVAFLGREGKLDAATLNSVADFFCLIPDPWGKFETWLLAT